MEGEIKIRKLTIPEQIYCCNIGPKSLYTTMDGYTDGINYKWKSEDGEWNSTPVLLAYNLKNIVDNIIGEWRIKGNRGK